MVDWSNKEVKPANIVLRAILASLTVLFLTFAGYNTVQTWATAPDKINSIKRPFDPSPDELAKLQTDQRLLRISNEQRAFNANPLASGPIERLAALARVNGKPKQADELILLASKRSLRDPKTLAEALPVLLARRDFAGALYRLDGLIRSRPERKSQLLPLAAAFAETKESRSALVAVLAQNPPWRAWLIAYTAESMTDASIAYRLLADLRNTEAPPTPYEMRRLLARLIKDHDYETGYFVWLDFLTEMELRKVSQIFDGGFDTVSKNLFFDWTYTPMENADLRIVPRTTTTMDRVLLIDFIGPRSRFANLSQLLRLQAGSYLFSGEVKTEYQPNDHALIWRVYCTGNQERLLAQTSRPPQSKGWERFDLALTIPDIGCDTQRLQLEHDARTKLDYKITGRVFYDNLKMVSNHQDQ